MSVAQLKIAQLNMGRAPAVSDQLLEYCQVTEVDIAMVQEPYTHRGKLTGFEAAPIRCFLSKGTRRRGRPNYADHGAAIIVFNQNLVIATRDSDKLKTLSALTLTVVQRVWSLLSAVTLNKGFRRMYMLRRWNSVCERLVIRYWLH